LNYKGRVLPSDILLSTASIDDPQYLKLGAAHELSNRYGDYFTASPDPSNGSMIWVAGEYHSRETWSIYVGQLYTVN
jgi:hypothetical protein